MYVYVYEYINLFFFFLRQSHSVTQAGVAGCTSASQVAGITGRCAPPCQASYIWSYHYSFLDR